MNINAINFNYSNSKVEVTLDSSIEGLEVGDVVMVEGVVSERIRFQHIDGNTVETDTPIFDGKTGNIVHSASEVG